jgi:hypothetical protein
LLIVSRKLSTTTEDAGGGGVEVHNPATRVKDHGAVTHALDDGVVRYRGDVEQPVTVEPPREREPGGEKW